MKIGHRGGHNEQAQGANGFVNEVIVDRLIDAAVDKYLKIDGNSTVNCTPGRCESRVDLAYGVNKANNAKVDIFDSNHVNAGGGFGCEVCYVSAKGKVIAERVCAKIVSLGFNDRGVKERTGLYELNNADAPAIIVEPFFLDTKSDVDIYNRVGADRIGKAIAEGLVGHNIGGNTISATPISTISTPIIVQPTPVYVAPAQSPIEKGKLYVGDRCLELQQKLNKVMGTTIATDTFYGNDTHNLLLQFQSKYNLAADGLAGTNVFNKLNSLISAMNTPAKVISQTNTGNDWIRRLQTECNKQGFSNQKVDGWYGENTVNGCPTMRQGANGNLTKLLQEKLNKLTYNTNGIDGIYGATTQNAICNFQTNHGLSRDGICGRSTWREIIKQ